MPAPRHPEGSASVSEKSRELTVPSAARELAGYSLDVLQQELDRDTTTASGAIHAYIGERTRFGAAPLGFHMYTQAQPNGDNASEVWISFPQKDHRMPEITHQTTVMIGGGVVKLANAYSNRFQEIPPDSLDDTLETIQKDIDAAFEAAGIDSATLRNDF